MPHSIVARKVPLDSEADAEKPLASLSRTHRLEEQELKLKQQQSDAESRERERERLPPAPSLATMLHDLGTHFACFTSTKVQILTPEEL